MNRLSCPATTSAIMEPPGNHGGAIATTTVLTVCRYSLLAVQFWPVDLTVSHAVEVIGR